jgi:hypothetical protein
MLTAGPGAVVEVASVWVLGQEHWRAPARRDNRTEGQRMFVIRITLASR